MNMYLKIFFCVFALINLSYSDEVPEFQEAQNYYNRGKHYDSDNQSDMEAAFVNLWKAHLNQSFRDAAVREIRKLDRAYDKWVTEHLPLFLDIPIPSDEEFYAIRARYKDPRGLRQYGELLLEQSEYVKAWQYLEEAATKGEPRALFLVGERYAKGLGGVEQDFKKAIEKMKESASRGYAPAWEMLAKVYWNGIWHQKRNFPHAIAYLKKSIELFKKWSLYDTETQENFSKVIDRMNWVLESMEFFADNPFSADGFLPSYEAMIITWFYPEHEGSLRAMLHYIRDEIESYRGDYVTGMLGCVDLSYVEIKIADLKGKYAGFCTHRYEKFTYSFKIEIDSSQYYAGPTANDDHRMWWWKRYRKTMFVVDTLAHELAHGYFAARYPHLADSATEAQRLTFEGHATTLAYRVMLNFYFCRDLSRAKYANEFLSKEYKRYFLWFNNPESKCISPSGLLINGSLDSREEAAAGKGYEVRTRAHVPSGEKTYWKPKYYGRAFYGYM